MRRLLLAPLAVLVLAVPATAARLPTLPSADWWPVSSPDGAHVAFTRVNGQGTSFTVEDVATATNRVVVLGASSSQADPTWSSNGAQLAYAAGGRLYVVEADGTGKHRYLSPAKSFAPAWRPGSDELAYLTTHGSTNTDLWVAGKLWATDAIGRPAWSSDGSEIAFQRDDGIYVATGPGAARRVVAATSPGPPAWSPNGRQIAFTESGNDALLVVPAAGGPVRLLAKGLANAGPPAWLPDGTAVAVSHAGGVWVAQLGGPGYALDRSAKSFGVGSAWLGPDAVVSASLPACPSRVGLVELAASSGRATALAGSCTS